MMSFFFFNLFHNAGLEMTLMRVLLVGFLDVES
jgi:hypothetical protein